MEVIHKFYDGAEMVADEHSCFIRYCGKDISEQYMIEYCELLKDDYDTFLRGGNKYMLPAIKFKIGRMSVSVLDENSVAYSYYLMHYAEKNLSKAIRVPEEVLDHIENAWTCLKKYQLRNQNIYTKLYCVDRSTDSETIHAYYVVYSMPDADESRIALIDANRTVKVNQFA